MALTKASLIDLNANELILDLDADTSITADTDDTIHFKIGGTDRVTIAGSALSPSSSDGSALGTTALEWSDLFLADGAVINFGDDQDVSLTHVADTGLLLSSTDQLQFGDSGTYIHQSADGVLDLVSDTEIEINATTIDMNGALEVSGTISSGGVITATGFTIGSAAILEAELELLDGLTIGTAIASKVVTTDANIDTTGQRNLTITGELDAATLDISGNADIDGTTNLDVVDIDGATQIDATVTVGVDDTGYDVKFFGATSGAYMLWDESVDDLILAGASRVVVPDGQLVLGSTAVTSTAAELNLIDGGTSRGTDALADGDGILINDAGTMKMTNVTAVKTYMQTGISTAYDDLTTGDAAVNIATSAGDITIDAQGNDTDIIFKGTDGNADTTFLTIDGSAAGKATFNNEVVATALDISGDADIDGTLEADAITINGTAIASVLSPVAGHASIATVGALNAGSITSGFGNIDNGASNITSGGLLKLDVDADANDVTGDSATGRLTLGAGEDLNLYHGGTDSYIVNDTGDLVIKNGASDEDILFQGNDGGGAITALTLDMSAAGAAGFNGVVTANAGVVVDNITIDGTEIDLSSGDLTLDVAGDIILDADGGDINFKDGGTSIFHISNDNSGDVHLEAQVSDKDLYIRGNDGGSTINAVYFDMSAAGAAIFNNNVTVGDNLILNTDAAQINFGADGEYSLIHNHDTGLILKSNATGDDTYPVLNLQTGQTDINDNDYLGFLTWNAPDEGTGTDAITTAAAIYARAEAEFSSSVNKTKLVFQTASSGAAVDRLTITGDGLGRSSFTAAAWANIDMNNGSGAANDSFNISGVADNAVGKHTISFDVALTYAYTGAAVCGDSGHVIGLANRATGSVQLICKESSGGADADRDGVSYVVHDSI